MPNTAPSVASLFDSGNAALAARDYPSAEKLFLQALQLDPGCAAVLANLAFVREQLRQTASACDLYLLAMRLDPANLQIALNYGALLTRVHAFADAEALYRQALSEWPQEVRLLSNYGALLALQKRDREAEALFRMALVIQPAYRNASYNLSYLLLRHCRWDEGWQRLEDRMWPDTLGKLFAFPRWRAEPCQDKAILLVFEGGYGDTIHFCRYALWLKQHGCHRIGIVCHPALRSLLQHSGLFDTVIPYDQDLPDEHWDYWVPLLSLPHCCGTQEPWHPPGGTYLHADSGLRAAWRSQLSSEQLKIGLAWQGNPDFENDASRSLRNLALLSALSDLPGIEWISLQIPATPVLPELPLKDVSTRIRDFADSAALICELDLVISVDTAAAHLSGALGKACWLLLPYEGQDWRWGIDGDTTAWYPAMHLLRQSAANDWTGLISQVRQKLQALLISAGS